MLVGDRSGGIRVGDDNCGILRGGKLRNGDVDGRGVSRRNDRIERADAHQRSGGKAGTGDVHGNGRVVRRKGRADGANGWRARRCAPLNRGDLDAGELRDAGSAREELAEDGSGRAGANSRGAEDMYVIGDTGHEGGSDDASAVGGDGYATARDVVRERDLPAGHKLTEGGEAGSKVHGSDSLRAELQVPENTVGVGGVARDGNRRGRCWQGYALRDRIGGGIDDKQRVRVRVRHEASDGDKFAVGRSRYGGTSSPGEADRGGGNGADSAGVDIDDGDRSGRICRDTGIDVGRIADDHNRAETGKRIGGGIAKSGAERDAVEDLEGRGIDDVEFVGIGAGDKQARAIGVQSETAEGANVANARDFGVESEIDDRDIVGVDVADEGEAAVRRNRYAGGIGAGVRGAEGSVVGGVELEDLRSVSVGDEEAFDGGRR